MISSNRAVKILKSALPEGVRDGDDAPEHIAVIEGV
jgi:hypothetical protein